MRYVIGFIITTGKTAAAIAAAVWSENGVQNGTATIYIPSPS